MNPQEEQVLKETRSLAQENNKILKKIQRAQRWSMVVRVIYWIIILGAAIGAFYFIQPYIDSINESYGSVRDALETASQTLSDIGQ